MERQFRSIQPRISARTIRTILIKHLRTIQFIINETQQLPSPEHAHIPFQLETYHGGIVTGNRGNKTFCKPTFRILRIRPQLGGPRDDIDDSIRGIPC